MKISIVIPIFNDTDNLPELIARLKRVEKTKGYVLEIILIDDGSKESIWKNLSGLKEKHKREKITLIRLKKNKGQPMATFLGLQHCSHPWIITMDSDLQHPPEEIPILLECLKEKNADLVYGTASKGHPLLYRVFSQPFRYLSRKFSPAKNVNASSFRAMRAHLVKRALDQKQLSFISLDSPLQENARSIMAAPTHHNKRKSGSSSYSIRKKTNLAFRISIASQPFYVLAICSTFVFFFIGVLPEFSYKIKAGSWLLTLGSAALAVLSLSIKKHKEKEIAALESSIKEIQK